MSTTTNTAADPTQERVDLNSDIDVCACHLYDAECALHAAHQSGVEQWVTAATARLHDAVVAYLAAVAAAEHADPRGSA